VNQALLCDYLPSSYSKTALTLKRSSDWTSTVWVSFQNTGVCLYDYGLLMLCVRLCFASFATPSCQVGQTQCDIASYEYLS
jgi:hypothetical protein